MRWDVGAGKLGSSADSFGKNQALFTRPWNKTKRESEATASLHQYPSTRGVGKSRELLDTAAGPTVAHVHAHALTRIQSYATLKGPADAQ
jgi:hypothetical protein